MSESKMREAMIRLATDPEFATRMEKDPAGFAAASGLTGDEVARLQDVQTAAVDPVDPTELLFDEVPRQTSPKGRGRSEG